MPEENTPEEHVVISSLIIDALPDKLDQVTHALEAIEGVEVHGRDDSQIVITLETETLVQSHDTANSFIGIEGVIGVNLIYANFEDDADLQAKQAALLNK